MLAIIIFEMLAIMLFEMLAIIIPKPPIIIIIIIAAADHNHNHHNPCGGQKGRTVSIYWINPNSIIASISKSRIANISRNYYC